jgi:hypothetical protein
LRNAAFECERTTRHDESRRVCLPGSNESGKPARTPIEKRTTSNWIGCGGNCCDRRMFSSKRDNDVSTITNAGRKGTLAQ